MNDKPQPHAYDLDEIYHFIFRKAGGVGRCFVCGNEEWVTEAPLEPRIANADFPDAPTYIMKSSETFWDRAPTIPTVSLTCTSCGFIRQHNISWLTDMMAEETRDE